MQASTILIVTAFLISAVRAGNFYIAFNSIYPDYNPSKVAAGVACGLYFIASLCLFTRLFMNRAWWGLCLPIASICKSPVHSLSRYYANWCTVMSIGFFMRIPLVTHPDSLPIFMVEQFFIILSPAAFLAFNYMLYGHFIVNCVDRHHSWIKPENVAKYFVISDITTFIIQGVGGGLEASTYVKLGMDILLAGLVIQTLSFAFFILLVVHAWRSILRDYVLPRQEPWEPILWILMFSSTVYMIRCIYRVAELAEGTGGYLVTHEVYFYLFDTLPLLIGICVYIFYWPTKYLEDSAKNTLNVQT
ncbi:hypothetical protein AZE42_07686 [Rhizopogon vesiculosus]|uniref:RTA1 like protein n=1 Tax=Rhizopogon vesiculosus TaxID=180088 RepID=A0A1J8QE77_9AGAM|nr:hypothetical protein AZE42_07686 [Rhizopogon vesiculosus]